MLIFFFVSMVFFLYTNVLVAVHVVLTSHGEDVAVPVDAVVQFCNFYYYCY